MKGKNKGVKERRKGKREICAEKSKKDCVYMWISLILASLFWVPLINLAALPASVFFGVKAIMNAKSQPERYGGRWVAIAAVVFAAVSFVFAATVFLMNVTGRIKP